MIAKSQERHASCFENTLDFLVPILSVGPLMRLVIKLNGKLRSNVRPVAEHEIYRLVVEVSACTTLSKAVTVDTLDAWILVSVAGSRNRPHIHLLPT
jgi:hypothetical protein